jgi:phospholipase C
MSFKNAASHTANGVRMGLLSLALLQFSVGAPMASAQTPDPSTATTSPIKHVIVIIGENRSFDHVFATYVPKKPGETVKNLLSEGIINKEGQPGWGWWAAHQDAAVDAASDQFLLSKSVV